MNICEVQDCNRESIARGLCDMHYRRMKRHGHLKQTRPSDWGKKEKHPLYHTWRWMFKMKIKYDIDSSWEDFWKFVKDVGERPTPRHQLHRKDRLLGYSPSNFIWLETIPNQDKAKYAKQWRKNNPDKVKDLELKKYFGIRLEDYNKMLETQEGVCAICRNKCSTGYSLAVDHCHKSNKIRGLLCVNCNKLLGHAKDSIEILNKAIQYLNKSNQLLDTVS